MTKQLFRCVLGFLGLIVVTAGPAHADDLDKMQGTWKATFIAVGSKEADKATLKEFHVIIDGNKFTLVEGSKKEVVHFTLDSNAKVPVIEFFKTSAKTEKIWHGIYMFEGKSLKLCWGPAGQKRPHEFETNKNDENRLCVLKKK